MVSRDFDITTINTFPKLLDYLRDELDWPIEEENLDIIFYPDIGMSAITYFLAFSRLAPVQIVSWGHPETTGIDTIDYFLSSQIIENLNSQKFYSKWDL